MDEIFHIRQAEFYCKGRWSEWDQKITTPPGLYILPALIHQTLPSWMPCTTERLRWTNGFLLCLLPLLNSRIIKHFRKTPYPPNPGVKPRVRFLVPEDNIIIEAIIVSCFPIVYFSGFLFYTDLGSLVSILSCYDQSLVGNHFFAGLLAIWSCFFRQTNIVWVAFIAGSALVERLKHLNMIVHQHCLKSTDSSPEGHHRDLKRSYDLWSYNLCLMDCSLRDLPRAIGSFFISIYQNRNQILTTVLPYLLVFLGFIVFVFWNGGIVLGDRSNHVVTFHLPQLYYFVSFSVAFLAPVSFDWTLISRSFKSLFGTPKSLAKSLILLGVMIWSVYQYTFEHPFLLSDNRHYTFYVWRRLFKFHWSVKYLLIPGYMVCIKLILERLARSYTTNLLTTTFFIIGLGLTLIPSPLIEPRYFIIPYVLLRLHVRPVVEETKTWSIRLMIEAMIYGVVNLVTIFVFLYRPFKSQPGEWETVWQRFMW
ncbi:alpha-2-glucosyltransferase Alg10 [Phakopsora pachyrhizi]|nr:alpha-2-glucosyltransferase Alg10 [Phakopsora pachyrhizi]